MTRPAFPDPGPRGALTRARAVFKARFRPDIMGTLRPCALPDGYSNLGEFLYDADVMGA